MGIDLCVIELRLIKVGLFFGPTCMSNRKFSHLMYCQTGGFEILTTTPTAKSEHNCIIDQTLLWRTLLTGNPFIKSYPSWVHGEHEVLKISWFCRSRLPNGLLIAEPTAIPFGHLGRQKSKNFQKISRTHLDGCKKGIPRVTYTPPTPPR